MPSSRPSDALAGCVAKPNCHLCVDLRVDFEIGVFATPETALVNTTGSDETGILLTNFFALGGQDDAVSNIDTTSTHLSDFSGTASGEILLSTDMTGTGINMLDLVTTDTLQFDTGQPAFEGDTTFSVGSGLYDDAVASGSTVFGGLIYFPANSTGDISSASVIGTWCRVV